VYNSPDFFFAPTGASGKVGIVVTYITTYKINNQLHNYDDINNDRITQSTCLDREWNVVALYKDL